jgi:hypothetical protein
MHDGRAMFAGRTLHEAEEVVRIRLDRSEREGRG